MNYLCWKDEEASLFKSLESESITEKNLEPVLQIFGAVHIKHVAAGAVRRPEMTEKEDLKHRSWKWCEEDKAQKATKPLDLETVRL